MCFEDIDLHRKYNFLCCLLKEIDITLGGNDFDIAGKITVIFQKPYKSGEFNPPCFAAEPEVEYPIPGAVIIGSDERKRLSKIIEEINAAYDKHFDTDTAVETAMQLKDILMKDERLKKSAKTNTFADFHFSYDDCVEDALLNGYEQNNEFFTFLLKNKDFKNRLMHIFIEDVFNGLRKAG